MPSFARRAGALAALAAACARAPAPGPGPVPVPVRDPVVVDSLPSGTPHGPVVVPPPRLRRPAAPAALARLRGWMPLASAGIPEFLAAHPAWDGRGVLIGILDSGLDPGVPGFDSTTDGRVKLLDLRDFSGEGRVTLSPVTPTGDSILVAGRTLSGFTRVRGLTTPGAWFGGALYEGRLGDPAASDANDNGIDTDTLAVVVGRASDGWVLFADTDGDGSLADERPVHDFLSGRETFGWTHGQEPPPLTLAANITEAGGEPRLDLFFDTSGHGTHVAGIAAANGIGGLRGFTGVAPGAQVIALKIARDDFGGITTTGSVLAALDYAIRFAAGRGMPLVLNMSFGVGNEREGAARLDTILDSVLAAHPEVVFVTSAGNDGPGLSTVGFPGSAERAITVGGTQPAALTAGGGEETLFFFSSRGGELAKPDVVAPGIAYSTVPRWKTGEEFMSGTSMASPYVAGAAALLRSAALDEHHEVTAEDLRRALVLSARPLPRQSAFDQGAGIPDLRSAWSVLRGPAPRSVWRVRADGGTAGWRLAPGPGDTLITFRIERTGGMEPAALTLVSDAPWLSAPGTLAIEGTGAVVHLRARPPRDPGTYVATVRATEAGSTAPAFVLRVGLVVPDAVRPERVRAMATLLPGAERRVVFAADSGRPFRVRISSAAARDTLLAALHLPGGQPVPDANGLPAGADSAAAVIDVDGRDAVAGYYEAVAVASPLAGAAARIAIDPSPVGLTAGLLEGDSVTTTLRAYGDSLSSGRLDVGLLGAERRWAVGGTGGDDLTLPVELPQWVRRLTVDFGMAREQWPRFSDFGLTVLDSMGRLLEKSPLNYATGRLSVELPPAAGGRAARIVLSPGWSDPGGKEKWSGTLTVRLEAERPLALAPAPGDEFSLRGAERATLKSLLGPAPWPLPAGYEPLGLFIVEAKGLSWSWELPLRKGAGAP